MKVIALSGGIASGKSTIGKDLERAFKDVKYYPEVFDTEKLNEFYLELGKLISGEKKESAIPLQFQFWMMAQRFKIYQEACRDVWFNGRFAIIDRSIWEDSIFCKSLYEQGFISKTGYEAYTMHLHTMSQLCLVPQIILYLDVDVDIELRRIKERRRPFEQGINKEYLVKWKEQAGVFLKDMERRGSEICIIDNTEFKDVNYVVNKLSEVGGVFGRYIV